MDRLSYSDSNTIASQFFSLFGYNGKKMAKKYLGKRPKTILNFTFLPHSFPTLWYPQRKNAKHITDIFDDFITFDWNHPNETLLETKFLPLIADFFKSKGINKLYAIMSFNPTGGNNSVGALGPDKLVQELARFSFIDNFIFPADFSWLFCNTHEHFSFLAGDKSFLDGFANKFPNVLSYNTAREYLNKPTQIVESETM